jgi:hypothetical protein
VIWSWVKKPMRDARVPCHRLSGTRFSAPTATVPHFSLSGLCAVIRLRHFFLISKCESSMTLPLSIPT